MAAAIALEHFLRGGVAAAIQKVDQVRQEDMAADAYFDAVCMRASIAALTGEGPQVVGGILARAPEEGLTRQQRAAAQYVEGLASLSRNQPVTALMKFEAALELDSTLMLAYLGKAAVLFHKKDYKGSFAQYRIVLEKLGSESPPLVRVGLGLAAYRLGHVQHARLCLERALAVNPTDVLAITALIVLYLRLRMVKEVTDLVSRLQQHAPDNIVALQKFADLVYLKYCQRPSAQTVASLQALLHTLVVRPEITPMQLAYSRFQQGRLEQATFSYEEAIRLYDECLQELPDLVAPKIHKAKALFKLGKKGECLALLDQVDASHKHEKELLEMLAVIHASDGRHHDAMKYTRRLTSSVGQGDPQAWALHAWCSRLNTPTALRLMRHYRSLHEATEQTRPSWQLLANIAALEKDVLTLRSLIAEQPALGPDFLRRQDISADHVAIVYNYALALESTGAAAEAAAVHRFLVKAMPSSVHSFIRLHKLALLEKKSAQALAWLALLREVHGDDPLAESYAASYFFHEGQQVLGSSILRSSTRKTATCNAISIGLMYLWSAQQQHAGASALTAGIDRLSHVLKEDPGNVLAAHAIACFGALVGNAREAQSGLESIGEVSPNAEYVHGNWNLHMGQACVQTGAFHQALDYFQRAAAAPGQAKASPVLHALCEAWSGNLDAAEKAMATAEREAQDDALALPMVQYNYALILFAKVISAVDGSHAVTDAEGHALNAALNKGIKLAKAFINLAPSSNPRLKQCKLFLNAAGTYCSGTVHELLNRAVDRGRRAVARVAQQQGQWRDAFASQKRQREQDELRAQNSKDVLQNDENGRAVEIYKNWFDHRQDTMDQQGGDAGLLGDGGEDPNGAEFLDGEDIGVMVGNIDDLLPNEDDGAEF